MKYIDRNSVFKFQNKYISLFKDKEKEKKFFFQNLIAKQIVLDWRATGTKWLVIKTFFI